MTHQEHIDNVMDWFNFSRVHKAMKALDWGWWDDGVPSEGTIRETARKRLKEAIKSRYSYPSSGGFTARWKDDVLELTFELASWDTSHLLGDEKEDAQ